jgi:hypothetical protein
MIKLNTEEKEYLFKKLEYKKKKKAIADENEIFQLLKGDKKSFIEEEFNKVIKSLEFTFRKRLSGDKPDLNNDLFKSIKSKIPSNTITVKSQRLQTKPTMNSSKPEIINYLKRKKIKYDENSTKKDLLKLIEEKVVFKYKDF